MEVAVVGGGIAGLSAAWRLSAHHRVTLIERHAVAGMDAHSLDLEHDGATHRIDVPLRVIYEGYYPTLISLYHALGVELVEAALREWQAPPAVDPPTPGSDPEAPPRVWWATRSLTGGAALPVGPVSFSHLPAPETVLELDIRS